MAKIQMTEGASRAIKGASRGVSVNGRTSGSEILDKHNARLAHQVQGLGSVNSVRQEVDDCFEQMRDFYDMQPDEVIRLTSGHSARMSHLKSLIRRVEEHLPYWREVRIGDVEVALSELTAQYQMASRLIAQQELDYKMSMGQQ